MSIIISLVLCTPVFSYTTESHYTLNFEPYSTQSQLSVYLENQLGFTARSETIFSGKSVREWLGLGGEEEDSPFWRSRNHFHDPLRDWDSSGLNLPNTQSAVVWAQDVANEWSWPVARGYFYQALTASTAAEREQAYADTFRALGQIMHLVEDMAVPAHVRNDLHVLEAVFKLSNYENIIGDILNPRSKMFSLEIFNSISRPVTFDPSLVASAANAQAPIPIGNVFDSDAYTGLSGADITATPLIGLAEYTNANFFSNDTIDVDQYPYPDPEPGSSYRQYGRKTLWLKTASSSTWSLTTACTALN
jgi:hypothetical protein